MGHLPRKYTDVGKKEARIANEALQSRLAIKELQEQMKNVKQQKAKPNPEPKTEPKPKPEPEDDLVIKQRDTKPSSGIQEAKERVNNYQQDSSFKQTYLGEDNFDAQQNFSQAESLDLNKYYQI